MIFELRTYDFAPGNALKYLDLFSREGVHLITRHLPMAGYWLTEIGALNRIRHAWIYRDLAERTAKRQAFMADTEWTAGFLPRGMALIARQESQLLQLTETSEMAKAVLGTAGGQIDPLPKGAPVLADGWVSLRSEAAGADVAGQVIAGAGRGSTIAFAREADPTATGADEVLRRCSFSPL